VVRQGELAGAAGRGDLPPEGADLLAQGPRRQVQAGLGIRQPLTLPILWLGDFMGEDLRTREPVIRF
jgi:hypothetical protein